MASSDLQGVVVITPSQKETNQFHWMLTMAKQNHLPRVLTPMSSTTSKKRAFVLWAEGGQAKQFRVLS